MAWSDQKQMHSYDAHRYTLLYFLKKLRHTEEMIISTEWHLTIVPSKCLTIYFKKNIHRADESVERDQAISTYPYYGTFQNEISRTYAPHRSYESNTRKRCGGTRDGTLARLRQKIERKIKNETCKGTGETMTRRGGLVQTNRRWFWSFDGSPTGPQRA